MAKKKSRKKRRRRTYKPRRRRQPKIPFEMLMGAIAIPFSSPADNWTGNPVEKIQSGQMNEAVYHLVRGFTGFDIPAGKINIMRAINPLDLGEARYWKLLFYTGLIGSLRARFVRSSTRLFRKIPLIGRWVK